MANTAEKWGRHYRLTHLWREVAPAIWRSRCGQVMDFFKPDSDDTEPRCLTCAKSAAKWYQLRGKDKPE